MRFDIDELEFELIDAGLEEIEVVEEMVYLSGEFTSFGTLSKALEDKSIEVKKATLKRFPTTPVDFTDEATRRY